MTDLNDASTSGKETFSYPEVAAPSNLTAEVVKGGKTMKVRCTWQDNSDNETAFNLRFVPVGGGPMTTWHADANTTEVVAEVPKGTYNVTAYAAGYYHSTDPSVPSTNLWSGPSNTVQISSGK